MKIKKKSVLLAIAIGLGLAFMSGSVVKSSVFANNSTETFSGKPNKITDPNVIWKEISSMKSLSGKDTTDGIFINSKFGANSKYCDFDFSIVADLASKDGATSELKNLNKNLTVKIKDGKEEVLTKVANNFKNEDGKNCFDFMVKHDELNLPEPQQGKFVGDLKKYKLEIYDDEKLIGTFHESLFLTLNNLNDVSMKIQTPDGVETSDRLIYNINRKNNLVVALFPKLYSENDVKNMPSVFAINNSVKVDVVDENGAVVSSVNTKQKEDETGEFECKIAEFGDDKKFDLGKSYTLKFYDGQKFLGQKHIKNFNVPFYEKINN